MQTPIDYVLVDACLARSLGAKAHPLTQEIRDVIEVLKIGATGICLTPLLRAEWEKHASRHMRLWLVQMVSRRRVKIERDRQVRDFRIAVRGLFDEGGDIEKKSAALKDAHLTECAILTRRAVISTDDSQRRILAELSVVYTRVGSIQWINPIQHYPACVAWLRDGCMDPVLGQIA